MEEKPSRLESGASSLRFLVSLRVLLFLRPANLSEAPTFQIVELLPVGQSNVKRKRLTLLSKPRFEPESALPGGVFERVGSTRRTDAVPRPRICFVANCFTRLNNSFKVTASTAASQDGNPVYDPVKRFQ
jgi:hypothetical protein